MHVAFIYEEAYTLDLKHVWYVSRKLSMYRWDTR